MHPEIEQDHPGDCPKCGMRLEPKTVATPTADDAEIRSLARKFWIGLGLTIPVLLIAMGGWLGLDVEAVIPRGISKWIEFALTTPVVFVGGQSVLCARLEIHRQSQPEYVHVDHGGRGRSLLLQRRGGGIPANLSGVISARQRGGALL